jgi:hypothetical protein
LRRPGRITATSKPNIAPDTASYPRISIATQTNLNDPRIALAISQIGYRDRYSRRINGNKLQLSKPGANSSQAQEFELVADRLDDRHIATHGGR